VEEGLEQGVCSRTINGVTLIGPLDRDNCHPSLSANGNGLCHARHRVSDPLSERSPGSFLMRRRGYVEGAQYLCSSYKFALPNARPYLFRNARSHIRRAPKGADSEERTWNGPSTPTTEGRTETVRASSQPRLLFIAAVQDLFRDLWKGFDSAILPNGTVVKDLGALHALVAASPVAAR
jgi:hypothetical protein